jgi:peptide/nickel transport system ATP-binding protein
MNSSAALLEVADLSVSYWQHPSWQAVLHNITFTIGPGEVFGLVGESGCGKSTLGLQLLGYRHPASRIDGGRVCFEGVDLLSLSRTDLDQLRGNRIGFVPQNPTTALNPGIRVGAQVIETLLSHGKSAELNSALDRTIELFQLVDLPRPAEIVLRYPHQLSGGQQQRICIAMSLACSPDLLVLDEPTTGLDVTTQQQIIELLVGLRERFGMSMLYVTHDLGVLAQIADRIGVMYAGHMVELARSADIFGQPRHPYTRGLIASIPRIDDVSKLAIRPLRGLLRREELPAGCPFQPRCDFAEPSCAFQPQMLEAVAPRHEVACQRWHVLEPPAAIGISEAAPSRPAHYIEPPLLALENVTLGYGLRRGWMGRFGRPRAFVAVRDLSISVERGETLALVGESGSGKSTVARAISGLLSPETGRILLKGQLLPDFVHARSGEQRRRIQYIFQNPDASLNPRARISSTLARPLEVFFDLDRESRRKRVSQVLADMRLDAGYADRYPDQLSGGERQRVAIARALIAEPELLICDEVLSALDVSVQASVLELLRGLRAQHQVAMLFIAHDLSVVRQLADRVAVLYRGELMEIGSAAAVFAPPFHPYTYSLMLAVPALNRVRRGHSVARSSAPVSIGGKGCCFAGRCPWQVGNVCETETPPWRQTKTLSIRCHLSLSELADRANGADPNFKVAGAS